MGNQCREKPGDAAHALVVQTLGGVADVMVIFVHAGRGAARTGVGWENSGRICSGRSLRLDGEINSDKLAPNQCNEGRDDSPTGGLTEEEPRFRVIWTAAYIAAQDVCMCES